MHLCTIFGRSKIGLWLKADNKTGFDDIIKGITSYFKNLPNAYHALKPIGAIFRFVLLLLLYVVRPCMSLLLVEQQQLIAERKRRERLLWSKREASFSSSSTKLTSVARHRQAYQHHLKVFTSALSRDKMQLFS